MKKGIMAIAAIAMSICNVSEAGFVESLGQVLRQTKEQPKTIKVLIKHNEPGALIGVYGKYRIYDPHAKKLVTTRFMGKCKYMEPLAEGLRWAEEFPGLYQLQIEPLEAIGRLTINGEEYKGSVFVYNVGGAISLVNEVSIDDYIASVISHAVHDPLESETYAAVAIAARSEALYQAACPVNGFWDVDAQEVGYKGCDEVNPSGPIAQAVVGTKKMVLSLGSQENAQFPQRFGMAPGVTIGAQSNGIAAKISVAQANELARHGHEAPEILSKAFPGARLHFDQ